MYPIAVLYLYKMMHVKVVHCTFPSALIIAKDQKPVFACREPAVSPRVQSYHAAGIKDEEGIH